MPAKQPLRTRYIPLVLFLAWLMIVVGSYRIHADGGTAGRSRRTVTTTATIRIPGPPTPAPTAQAAQRVTRYQRQPCLETRHDNPNRCR